MKNVCIMKVCVWGTLTRLKQVWLITKIISFISSNFHNLINGILDSFFPTLNSWFYPLKLWNYSRRFEFVIVSVPYRTVSVPFSVLFTGQFYTAIATVTVPFFSLTVISGKRTEPLIFTVRLFVFDREPYRTKMGTVNRLTLRTAPHHLAMAVRCGSPSSIITG